MQNQFINFNGEIVSAQKEVLKVSNRAFRYGDGLFETMRLVNGELKYADLHADRLQRGMKMLKMEGGILMDAYFLREKVEELCRKNKTGPNARARFAVYREDGGLYSPVSNKTGFVIEVNKTEEVGYATNARGLIVDVYDEMTKPINALSNFKTSSSLVYVMAGIFKTQNRLDDVVLLNQNGFLCESLTSNIFVVYDKKVYTPALTEGCIGGIMRAVTLGIAKQNNMPVIEAQINPAVLHEAEEVFVTNAGRGIQWVMGYNRKRYFNEVSRLLAEKLNGG